MIYRMFTVYDVKAEAYLVPFFARTRGEATRMFANSANDPNHQFFTNGEDFSLYALGEYDDSDGSIEALAEPEFIAKAIHLKKPEMGSPEMMQAILDETENKDNPK
jgi:hypothetical protein